MWRHATKELVILLVHGVLVFFVVHMLDLVAFLVNPNNTVHPVLELLFLWLFEFLAIEEIQNPRLPHEPPIRYQHPLLLLMNMATRPTQFHIFFTAQVLLEYLIKLLVQLFVMAGVFAYVLTIDLQSIVTDESRRVWKKILILQFSMYLGATFFLSLIRFFVRFFFLLFVVGGILDDTIWPNQFTARFKFWLPLVFCIVLLILSFL